MQQALPEDLWFFIIIMALLILAYLWNDRGGSGSSGGKKKRKKKKKRRTPDEPEAPEEPPDIRIGRRGSTTPGEECWIKASFTSGTGEIQELKAEINDQEVGIRERQGNTFVSNPAEVQEGENRLKATITTDVATKTDSETFPAGERVPDDEEGPTLQISYEILDESNGHVRIEASAQAGSASISQTAISLSTRDRTVGGNSENGDYCEFEAEGLPPGNYVIDAVTRDENSLTKEKTETFPLEGTTGPGTGPVGPGGGDGPGGGGGQQGMPNIFNPQIEASPEINLDVPEEAISILQDIVGEVQREDASGDVSQEVGMEGYQILMAMHMLQNGLDGEDNQQIVSELERIRENLGQGDVPADTLENSLRSVLHDVFGQDLQDILEGLEVEGFDEEAIVRAINENNVDLEPLAARLSDIEQAVGELESQGTDLTDIEARLDSIEEAVEDTGNIDRGAVNPMAMTRDPEESGSGGNKNEENGNGGMPDNIEGLEHELDTDIERQIEHLEGEYNNLRELVQDQGEIETLESHMEHEIEEVTEHLKKARQIEHHLDRLFDEKKNMSDSKFADKLNDDIHRLNGHISKANNVISKFRDDFGVFREDVSDLENVVDSMDKVEGQIEQQEEELGQVEQHMENAISQLQSNPDVDMSEYTK